MCLWILSGKKTKLSLVNTENEPNNWLTNNEWFIGLTAHSVLDNQMKSVFLSCRDIEKSHAIENLSGEIKVELYVELLKIF